MIREEAPVGCARSNIGYAVLAPGVAYCTCTVEIRLCPAFLLEPAVSEQLIAIVKRDCPTCELVVPVLEQLALQKAVVVYSHTHSNKR